MESKYRPLIVNEIKKNGYLISECGDIYSLFRKKVLSPKKDKDGYLSISLVSNNGQRKMMRIARLVALTFIGNPHCDMKDPTVDHIDGNKENNHFSNLRWLERGVNTSTRKNKPIGSKNHFASLNEKTVEKICEYLMSGQYSYSSIAKIFSVSKSAISLIGQKKTWKNIVCKYNFPKREIGRDATSGQFVRLLQTQGLIEKNGSTGSD